MLQTSVLFNQNYNATAPVIINQGGANAGKTFAIAQVLFCLACREEGQVITVVGQDIPNLKAGVLRDAQKIHANSAHFMLMVKSFNKTDRIFEFHNGTVIEFKSYTDAQDAKSGKRDYLFVNEANGITWDIYTELALRTRKRIAPATGPVDFTIGVQPRILVDNKIDLRQTGGQTVNFTDGATTTPVNGIISVPYFYKDDGEYNLCWCDKTSTGSQIPVPGLRSKYYGPLQKILQNTKLVVRYLLLTPGDIAELDLLIPVYLQQHNAYFYINKIDSWRKGQPCKVELVRLG